MYSKTQIEIWNLEATIEEIEAKLMALEECSIYGLDFGESKRQEELEKKLHRAWRKLQRLEAKGV